MKYSISSSKWEGEIIAEYHHNKKIKSVIFPDVIDAETLMFFATHFPVSIDIIDYYKERKWGKIVEIPEDLTFDNFWESYQKKEGSKDNASLYWEGSKKTINKRGITETDRSDIMKVLPSFLSRYKGPQKIFQPLPTTFLNQRLWIAELERLNSIIHSQGNSVVTDKALLLIEKWNINK